MRRQVWGGSLGLQEQEAQTESEPVNASPDCISRQPEEEREGVMRVHVYENDLNFMSSFTYTFQILKSR